jgi:hypothetical protein
MDEGHRLIIKHFPNQALPSRRQHVGDNDVGLGCVLVPPAVDTDSTEPSIG